MQFLSLEKIEEGRLELEVVDFSPAGMLRDAVRTFGAPLQRKRLAVTLVYADDAPRVMRGDPHRLRQVVSNFM